MGDKSSGLTGEVEVGSRDSTGGCPLNGLEGAEARRLAPAGKAADARDREPYFAGKFSLGDLFGLEICIEPHVRYLHRAQKRCNIILARGGIDGGAPMPQFLRMPRKSSIANAPNSVAAWRLKRGYSQEKLAEMVGSTAATISRLETGKTPYSQGQIEAIATALRCSVSDLLAKDDSGAEDLEIRDRTRGMSPAQKRRVLRLIRALTETEAG